jgi:hypothetical protein
MEPMAFGLLTPAGRLELKVPEQNRHQDEAWHVIAFAKN